MDIINEHNAVIQSLAPSWYHNKVTAVDILRLDRIHPVISGNKWYKLKHNLQFAISNGFRSVLTFGGPWSNHLVATAAAAQKFKLQSIGLVRGLHAATSLTATLDACQDYGMQLQFLSREAYNGKQQAAWLEALSQQYPGAFIIPEGGANEWGREGAATIAGMIPATYTHVCCAVGTGTTFTGLRAGLGDDQYLLGFVPMKGGRYLQQDIEKHLPLHKNTLWQLFDEWHFSGFGKWNTTLINFMNAFYKQHRIPLDIIYTSKMMYAVQALLVQDFFPPTSRILCIHSGGLQGNVSVRQQLIY